MDQEVLTKQVIETTVNTVLDDGTMLEESVGLTLSDFALENLQALAYWEEIDPETYKLFVDGTITVGSFTGSAVKLRGFLFAVVKSKIRDSRIRNRMDSGDFDILAGELAAIVGAIDDIKVAQ